MSLVVNNLNNIEKKIKSKVKDLNSNISPKIIAVSKTFKMDHIIPAIEHGHSDFGENRVQETLEKWSSIKKIHKNIKLAIKLGLDGAYIPSFNRSKKHLSYSLKSNFLLIGSAHTNKEIKIKELQKVKVIFISSLFKKNKNFLGINKFKLLSKLTNRKIVSLGGINKKNIRRLNLISCFGFAGISFFK